MRRAAAAMARTGRAWAVADAIWSTISSFVRPGRSAARIRETTSPSGAPSGNATVRAVAPDRRHCRRVASATAPYVWSVSRTSSPASSRTDWSTSDTPAVVLGTRALPSGSAPRNAAR